MQRTPRRRHTEDVKAQATALADSPGGAKAVWHLDISVRPLGNRLDPSRAGHPLSSLSSRPVGDLESAATRFGA